jgi:hypothetical protein
MHDDLIERLTDVRPSTPTTLQVPDAQLVEDILATGAPAKRRLVTPLRLASVAAVAAAVVAVLVMLPAAKTSPPTLDMRAIVESTNVALQTGRAHVQLLTNTDKLGPMPRTSGADFTVEFSGGDRSMYGTVDPGDGRSSAFPIANKVVAGQFYLQDGNRWVKNTNNANMSGEDAFNVDPRSYLGVVAQDARFEDVGHTTFDGVDVRHLKATNLAGIPDFNLGLGPTKARDNELTAFELWVDGDNVVRGIHVGMERREETYPGALARIVDGRKEIDPATMGDPVVVTITSHYKVRFTDIGDPIEITAPANAVEVAGKG